MWKILCKHSVPSKLLMSAAFCHCRSGVNTQQTNKMQFLAVFRRNIDLIKNDEIDSEIECHQRKLKI